MNMDQRLPRRETCLFFVVVSAALLAVVFYYHGRVVSVSEEAMVCSGVGGDFLAGRLEGRQGLVGSLKWPPFPTLLGLPFVKIPHFGTSGLAFPVVNAIVSAFMLTLLNGWLSRFGIPRLARFPILGFYQASPPVIAAVLTGSSATMLLLMLMAGGYFLVHWLRTLDLRSLAYLGVLGGLSVITRYQAIVLVILVTAVIVARTLRAKEPSFRPATLLVFLIPSLYTVGLWFMGNWLIMGDPVYFLRGVVPMESGSVGAEIIPACRGVDWQLYLPPLLLFVVAWLTGKDWRGSAWRSVTLPLALMALLALIVWPYVAEIRSLADRPDSIPIPSGHARQLKEVDDIVLYLAEQRPEAKVFVSGYTGYPFVIRSQTPDAFVHLMTLDPGEIQRRTRGQTLLFLVPRPKGLNAWEDINLRLPWLFDEYMKHLLVDRDLCFSFVLVKEWDDWHLIEAVRLERPPDKLAR